MRTATNSIRPKTTTRQLPLPISVMAALSAGAMFSLALAPYFIIPIAVLSPMLLYALLKSAIALSGPSGWVSSTDLGLGWSVHFGYITHSLLWRSTKLGCTCINWGNVADYGAVSCLDGMGICSI